MPRELLEKYWSSQNEASQVKSVREIFQMYKTDPVPIVFVSNLMDYFNPCSHSCNQLMHSVARADYVSWRIAACSSRTKPSIRFSWAAIGRSRRSV